MEEKEEHTEAQQSRNHKLSTIADSIDSAILNDDTLVRAQQALKGTNDTAEIRLITLVVIHPLGIKDIMEGDHAVLFAHSTGANTAKFLHMSTDTEQKTKVNTEGSDIGTGLTADPEDTQMAIIVELVKLALVDSSDTELSLDSGNEGRALEQSTSQGLQSSSELGLAAGDFVVESDDADVLLTSTLLGLDKASGTVDTDDKTASDLGIKSTAVTSLLNSVGVNS